MPVRPTRVAVDLAALEHNLSVARARAGRAAICAVIKAHAYGHGLSDIGLFLQEHAIGALGVALVEEGVALREAGVESPILVLSGALAGGYDAVVEHRLTPVVYDLGQLAGLQRAARRAPIGVHVKVDTGMARLGVAPHALETFLDALAQNDRLRLTGLMSHYANADVLDAQRNAEQLEAFAAACAAAGRRVPALTRHIANSAALLSSAADDLYDMVRPGLLLFGYDPRATPEAETLKPVMRWTTAPVQIKTVPPGTRVSYGGRWCATRPSVLATLPVGYADGYPRIMGGEAEVSVRGRRAPVVGNICMDLCIADVTDVPGVSLGDEVVLLGGQNAGEPTAYDLARWAQTLPYEILTGVQARVPRSYQRSARA